jgi:hypothetical protein
MAPQCGPTRAERIVARAEEELIRCSKDCTHGSRDLVIGTALEQVQQYAESLEHRATFVGVSRMIFAAVAYALGKLDFPANRLSELNKFGEDINTMVHSTTDALRR